MKILSLFVSLLFFQYLVNGQVKIMPLGDSITRGSAGSYNSRGEHIIIGFRGQLYNLLKNSGYNIDFVGTGSDGPPSLPYFGVPSNYDYNNEGHSGWQAAQLPSDPSYPQYDMLSRIDSFLTSKSPDIILMHLGTNDLESGQSPSSVVNNVNSLLNKIYAFNSNTIVFLAKIINRGLQVYSPDSSIYQYGTNIYSFNDPNAPANIRNLTTNYNKLIGEMIDNRILNGDKIIPVDMETAITNYNEDSSAFSSYPHGNLIDSFHPNQRGYNEMAGVWFNALDNYFIGKPVLAGPLNNSRNLATPINFTWGITANAVSYILQISKDQNFTPDSLIYNNLVTDRYANVNINFESSRKYYWRVAGQTSQGQTYYSEKWNFTALPVTISAKVFLQGPYLGGDTMSTVLNRKHYIPLSQPYSTGPLDYKGDEKVTAIPAGVVDWVLLELRTGKTQSTTVARRAAFVKSDGSIVDLDGCSPVTFIGIASGGYYLVIRHRNHLSIMSSDTISCSHVTSYDFTTSPTNAYGINPMVNLGDGNYGMISGDDNKDQTISVSDYNLISKNLTQTGYHQSDNNMDGKVSLDDYNLVRCNLFKFTKVP